MASSSGSPQPAAEDAPIATHLARFEFSQEGTKVLMVEWQPGAAMAAESPSETPAGSTAPKSESAAGAWEVSWPGKSTFVPAGDADQDSPRRRVYFLLPPQASVPATVTISRPGGPSLDVKPLPAIFPEGFAADSGTRGVLHTIWAKRRVKELEREIDDELRTNAESVGVEMAVAERQFIVDSFLNPPASAVPMSPRSPVGGRLGDKLKGLRLATSPSDLVPSPTGNSPLGLNCAADIGSDPAVANTFTGLDSLSLSPQGSDYAVASFSALPKGPGGAVSLDAALQGESAMRAPDSQDNEDDLFALPISPRSPDMKKSPFSSL